MSVKEKKEQPPVSSTDLKRRKQKRKSVGKKRTGERERELKTGKYKKN